MRLPLSKFALFAAVLVLVRPPTFAADSTAAPATASPASRLAALFSDEVVAQGDGVKVMRSMLDEEVDNIRATAASGGGKLPPGLYIEARVLNNILGRVLLCKRATEADKAVGAESAAKKLAAITPEALARQLRTYGLTMEQLKAKLTEEDTAEAVLQREVKFEVTDEDVKKFYDEHPTRFEWPEMVHPAQIFFSTREKDGSEMSAEKKQAQRKRAEDVLKRARAGEDFAKLAKDFSDDPQSKENGGDTGQFPRGLPQVPPEFEARAFSLETNQIGDIVTTQIGYHIIKLLEKKPARKVELAEVAARVKADLKREGMMKLVPGYLDGVMKEAKVEILDKDLNKFIEDQRAAEKEALQKTEAKAAEQAKPVSKK